MKAIIGGLYNYGVRTMYVTEDKYINHYTQTHTYIKRTEYT